jgi:hypothetical protein
MENLNNVSSESLPCCMICMEDIKKDEKPSDLKCKHVFHETCVDEWINAFKGKTTPATCPICRAVIAEPSVKINQINQIANNNNVQNNNNQPNNQDNGQVNFEMQYIMQPIQNRISSISILDDNDMGMVIYQTLSNINQY